VGAKRDRALFNKSHIMQHLDAHLTGNEVLMTDMGLTGEGPIVFPFKSGRALYFELHGLWNNMIRKKRMINKWGVGYVSNRHRIFSDAGHMMTTCFLFAMKVV
jgi:hypothetical protein